MRMLLVLVSCLAMPMVASAQAQAQILIGRTLRPAPYFASPDSNSPKLGELEVDRIVVIEKSENNFFQFFAPSGVMAWVSQEALEAFPDPLASQPSEAEKRESDYPESWRPFFYQGVRYYLVPL